MPEISKEWVLALSPEKLEHALSLGLYHYRSTLLFIHTDEWWRTLFDNNTTEEEKAVIFNEFLKHYLLMWASMVFVVQEGFVELEIADKLLDRAVRKVGYDRMRRFRNATFHYQKRIRDARHGELFGEFDAVRAVFERQGVLVRRLSRFIKLRPDVDIVL
jgi:hypothetical protein